MPLTIRRVTVDPRDGGPEARLDQGEVYGPYLALDDPRLIGSTDGTTDPDGRLNVYFPGEGAYDESQPKVIVDYWGNPISYFRRVYPQGAIERSYRPVVPLGGGLPSAVPTLSNVYLLRPFNIDPGTDIELDGQLADDNNDVFSTIALNSAEFALFSAGPDLRFNARPRYDGDEQFNADNIVEVGP